MSGLYRKGASRLLNGDTDWVTSTIWAALVRGTYVPDYANHEFISSVSPFFTSSATTNDKILMTGRTVVNGALDSNDLLFPSVPTNATPAEGIVIFRRIGTGTPIDSTSPILMYLDGKYPVIVAEDAIVGATVLKVDRLSGSLDNGTVLDFGGGVTATLSEAATVGSRSVAVTALTAPVSVNAVAMPRVVNSGFPMTLNDTDKVYIFDEGPNRIVRL